MSAKSLAHTAGAFLAAYAKELARVVPGEQWEQDILVPAADAILESRGTRPQAEAEEGLVRDGVLNYTVLPMLSSDPSVAPRMLRCLSAAADRAWTRARQGPPGAAVGVSRRFISAHTQLTRLAKLHAQAHDDPVVSAAVMHAKTVVRMQALELLTFGQKGTELPGQRECSVVLDFLRRNLKSADQSLRSALSQYLRKWLQRCREAVRRHDADAQTRKTARAHDPRRESTERHLAEFARYLVLSSYAGSPLDRRVFALQMLKEVVVSFRADALSSNDVPAAKSCFLGIATACLPPELVQVLLGSLRETWDRVRSAALDILSVADSPLPGYEHVEQVQTLAVAAAEDLSASQMKRADAGALVWRLIHRKYRVELGWTLSMSTDYKVTVISQPPPSSRPPSFPAHLEGAVQLLALLRARHHAGASRFAPVHGIIGALRQVLFEAKIDELVKTSAEGSVVPAPGVDVSGWRAVLSGMVEFLTKVCQDAMKLVACVSKGTDEEEDEGEEAPVGVDCRGHAFYADREDAQEDRMVVVNAWLAVKEGCTLLADIAASTPLAEPGHPAEMLPQQRVGEMGESLVGMVLASKHNGAIAKAATALYRLSHRCLRCTLPALRALPSAWLEHLLQEGGVRSSDGTRALRRSGGLPPALLALLEAEDHDVAVPVLARTALESLLGVAEEDYQEEVPEEPRINALNALKYLIESQCLKDVVQVYAARALVVALRGLDRAQLGRTWKVRNSSLILFSAIVQRSIGVARAAGGRTSLKDFAARHAAAVPAILAALHAATDPRSGSVHEALFPILLLLSLLAPSTGSSASSAQFLYFGGQAQQALERGGTSAELLMLVDRCHALKDGLARAAAARAFAPLVCGEVLPAAAARIAGQLPAHGEAVVNNAAHGRLLQLDALLAAAEALERDKHEEVLAAVCGALERRGWLVSVELGATHAPTAGSGSLSAMVAAQWWETARQRLLNSAAPSAFVSCCADRSRSIPDSSRRDAGAPRLAEAAAAAHVAALLVLGRSSDAVAHILSLARDTPSAVAAALSALGDFRASLTAEDDTALRRGMLGVAAGLAEKAQREPAAARSIAFVGMAQAVLEAAGTGAGEISADDLSVAEKLWTLERTPNPALLAAVLATQGAVVGAAASRKELGRACAGSLATALLRHAHPARPMDARQGCVRALAAVDLNRLMTQAAAGDDEAAALLPALLRTAAVLLSDEQDAVRDAASLVVPHPDGAGDTPLLSTGGSLPQCERALELCFECFAACATRNTTALAPCVEHLVAMLLHPATPGLPAVVFEGSTLESEAAPDLPFGAEEGTAGAVDADTENYWAEDMLTCQLAGRALLSILAGPRGKAAAVVLRRAARRGAVEAEAVASVLERTPAARPSAFLSVYRLRLFAAVCSAAPRDTDPGDDLELHTARIRNVLSWAASEKLWADGLNDGDGSHDCTTALFLLPRA
eukprot:Hpha_TRINITY_DN11055_c0_g1::TRINITY_DN11055_c0_g1_i2::g.92778::m.92778